MAEENMQDMESKREKSAAEKKAAQAAKKGAKKAAKSLKNGGKLAKFFANPVGLIILVVILVIIMLIGFLSFFLSMPGKVLGQIFDFLNGFWNNIEQIVIGEAAFLEANQVVVVGQYLEDMGYDLQSYGFGMPNYETDSEGNIKKNDKGGQIIKGGKESGLLDDTENDVLYNYLLSDLKTYALAKLTFAGPEGTGMIDIEEGDFEWYDHITDGVKVDREKKIMEIIRWNPEGWDWFNRDTYVYDLDGWSGRYGKPLELLLTLHLATMTPDISMALATRDEFNTKVNIGLKEQKNHVRVTYKASDGTDTELDEYELRDAYIDLRASALKNLLDNQELYMPGIEGYIDAVETNLGTYEEYINSTKIPETTDKIDNLLETTDTVSCLGVESYEDLDRANKMLFITLGFKSDRLSQRNILKKYTIPHDIMKCFYSEELIDTSGTPTINRYWGNGGGVLANQVEAVAEEYGIELSKEEKEILSYFVGNFENGGVEPGTYGFNFAIAGYTKTNNFFANDTNKPLYEFVWTYMIPDKIYTVTHIGSFAADGFWTEYEDTNGNKKNLYTQEVLRSIDMPIAIIGELENNNSYNINDLRKVYVDMIKTAEKLNSLIDIMDRVVDEVAAEIELNIKDTIGYDISYIALKQAAEINFGKTGSKLTKQTQIQNGGLGKEVKTYQPYIQSVTKAWFKDVVFKDDDDNINVYETESGVDLEYKYNPQEGSDSSALVENDKGAFWIKEKQDTAYTQTSNPTVKGINKNTIKLFVGDNTQDATDDPKYYIYDGTKRTAEIIHLLEAKDLLDSSAFINSYIEKMKDLGIETVEELEKIEKTIKRPISLDRNSLTAFSILENAGTLDSEYILRDLKELLIELKYFTEDDFIEYDTNVLEFIVPSAQIEPDEATGKTQWPDTKVYEDESKTEKPVMEYYTGIRKERFNVGENVIAPGTGIITDSTDTSITIKFITPTQIEGMKMTIEGFKVDTSNATNITYDGKTEKKIEKGVTIGTTSDTMIKMYLYDVDDSIINDVEEYMNPFELAKNDMVVKIDDDRSPKIITDKETLKSVIEKGWSGDKTNLTSDEVLDALLEAQEKYNVNALFLAAITIKESSGGTAWDLIDSSTYNWCSIKGSYNGNSKDEWRSYLSFAEAITDCAKLIYEDYFNDDEEKDAKVDRNIWISTIGKKYCPPGTEWSEGVANIMSNFYENVY